MVVESQGPGWARQESRRNPYAHLHVFLGFLFAKAGGLSPRKFSWILTLYRAGVRFLQRPRKRQGGEGS